jgi:hypothetical protein
MRSARSLRGRELTWQLASIPIPLPGEILWYPLRLERLGSRPPGNPAASSRNSLAQRRLTEEPGSQACPRSFPLPRFISPLRSGVADLPAR